MEAAAANRKEKLQALRKRKAAEDAGTASKGAVRLRRDGQDEDDEADEGLLAKRSFRNYDPQSRQMRRAAAAAAAQDTVEQAVAGLQARVIAEDAAKRQEELDLTNIAPKRPNWDLKRDLTKRLAKLERKDKEAILTLIRRRIGAQQEAAGASSRAGETAGLDAATAEMAAGATMQRGAGRLGLESEDEDEEDD